MLEIGGKHIVSAFSHPYDTEIPYRVDYPVVASLERIASGRFTMCKVKRETPSRLFTSLGFLAAPVLPVPATL
jgi:hypothetical protein